MYTHTDTHTFLFFEKFVEVAMEVTFRQHKRVYDKSKVIPPTRLQSPSSRDNFVCSLCLLYTFLCRYKHCISYVCLSFSFLQIATYSTYFLDLVFQSLHLANHSKCTEVQAALVLSAVGAFWFWFSMLF